MAGIKLPKAKAPKAPKAPKVDPKKASGAAKKKAAGKAKGALKKIFNVKVLIILLIIVAVVLITLMLTIWAPGPIDVVEDAAAAAKEGDEARFRSYFTDETILRLESAWGIAEGKRAPIKREGSWKLMMSDILSISRHEPEYLGDKVEGDLGEVYIERDNESLVVYMRLVDGDWKIHVPDTLLNQALPPLSADVPDDIKEKIKENAPPPNNLWWEGREVGEDEKDKKGCLGCVVVARPEDKTIPADALLWLVGLSLLLIGRARTRDAGPPA